MPPRDGWGHPKRNPHDTRPTSHPASPDATGAAFELRFHFETQGVSAGRGLFASTLLLWVVVR
jgi:hypothetical protein